MDKLFANSGDPDQTPHFAASDLGLHCLPIILLGISRLQRVKTFETWDELINPTILSVNNSAYYLNCLNTLNIIFVL